MIILIHLDREKPILVENFLARIAIYGNKEFEENNIKLLKLLKSVSGYERILLTSNREIRNLPVNKFLLSLDSMLLRFNENYPYVRAALSNKYIWFTSIGVLILYSGSLPVYLRNFKIIPGSSEIIRPIY